ncbi:MAG: penicillin-binding protein transpeptidase, partial [Gemmatimonadetes bacterium]|nr:penicillin-binding protein transpeptidase [Gemmatimonadota bacterium]
PSVVAVLPLPATVQAVPRPPRPVPDVHAMSLRQAVHALHAAGFRVRLVAGPMGLTIPQAGVMTQAGSIVSLAGTP